MSAPKSVLPHSLPAARPYSKTGVRLPPKALRAAQRGVAQINRGEGVEFSSGREAAAHLRKLTGKA